MLSPKQSKVYRRAHRENLVDVLLPDWALGATGAMVILNAAGLLEVPFLVAMIPFFFAWGFLLFRISCQAIAFSLKQLLKGVRTR